MNLYSAILSYWWLLVIIIIILALITRNVLKLFLGIIILVFVIWILLWITNLILGPALSKLGDCYTTTFGATQRLGEKIKQKQLTVDQYCEQDKKLLLDVLSCYENVHKISPISVRNLEKILNIGRPHANQYLKTFVSEHNKLCFTNPSSLINNIDY